MSAGGTRTIKIRVDGDARGVGSLADDGERHLSRLSSGFAKFGKAAALGVAAATVALVSFGKESVSAFVESEQAQTRLADAYKRFPKTANLSIDALREFNSELAKKVRFDDDALATGQATLAQFGLTGQQLRTITPLLADFAAKTGRDLPTAAETLGKAFLGNTKALKELGINYKSTGDQAKDTANITALLRKQVGGFAEAEGKTAAGRAEIMKNQFGELQEAIGAKLLPVLMTLSTWILEVGIPALERFVEWMRAHLGPAIVTVWGWIRENVFPIARTFGEILTGVIVPALTSVLSWLRDNWNWLQVVAGAIGAAVIAWTTFNAVVTAWKTIGETVTAVQIALNAAMAANPIGLVITVIAALVVAFILLWNKSEAFRNFFIGMWETIKSVVGTVVGWIVDRWNGLMDFFRGIPGFFRGIGEGMADAIRSGFRTAVNWVVDILNRLVDAANVVIGGINAVSPFGDIPPIPHVPRMARGGLVTQGGVAMLGERGRELAFMPAGARVVPHDQTEQIMSGGGAPEVHVYIGERELSDIVRVEVREGNRATNRSFLAGVGGAR